MSAGLPGLGLGGLFFILSALLAPVGELARTLRGRSSRERWGQVGRQFTMALAMVAAIQVTLMAIALVAGRPALAIGVPMLGVTLGVLADVLLAAKLAAVISVVISNAGKRRGLLRSLRWALLGSNQ